MSTYSDILAGIRANAVKTPQGDGKTVLAKFLNGTIGKPTAPTEKQPPTDAPAPETMSAGALPEPDEDGDLFEPPQPQKRHGGRRK